MKRVMLDLETLSTFPNAAVIAIGVVIREDGQTHKQARSWFIDRDFVIGHEDPATIEWWNAQDPRVKNQVFGGNQLPKEALQELNGFLRSNGINPENGGDGYRCYASPAMFDFPILRHQYQMLGISPAWHWRSERCLSTIKKEIRDHFNIEIPDFTPDLAHHPVHDCLSQFQELDACFSELSLRARR